MPNSPQPKTWRDVLPVHPAAELFPRMSESELRELGEDIKKNGLRVPVTLWKEQKHFPPQLLDGRNRLDAIEAAGWTIRIENVGTDADPAIRVSMRQSSKDMWWPIDPIEVRGDNGIDPYAYVISANIHRRHLTAAQKRELIAKLLKATPEKSNRQIAKIVGRSHPHVAKVREELEKAGDVETVTTSIDTKGRKQPSRKTRKPQPREADAVKCEPSTLMRDDVGPTSGAEIARRDAAIEELHNAKRRLEIENEGLRSEIVELKGAATAAPESKSASRCSICHEKKQAVQRPVFICNDCVHTFEVGEAAPTPADDGLDIPGFLRRAR